MAVIFEEIQNNLDIKTDFGMYYCGKRENAEHHVYGPQVRSHYLAVFVTEGKAVLHGEEEVHFGKHDLLVMCPGERIHYEALTPWSIKWLGFYGLTAEECMRSLGVCGKKPIVHVSLFAEMEGVLDRIYAVSADRSRGAMLEQASLIMQFFSVLLRCTAAKSETDYVSHALKVIEYNFNNGLTVQKLANSLHVDPSYLSRLFSERIGKSPKRVILEKQMEMAKSLLLTTETPIAEIAASVGFSDPLYFSKSFSRWLGCNPTTYRSIQKSK